MMVHDNGLLRWHKPNVARRIRACNVDALSTLIISVSPCVHEILNVNPPFGSAKVPKCEPWDAPKWSNLRSRFFFKHELII